jgi:perosamine synthetase
MNFKIDWPQRGHGYTEIEICAVANVMRSRNTSLTQGSNVRQFEEKFSEYTGIKHSFAVMSCAHALDIAAMLINIVPGDEVIIPSHTYCATALAFARRGAIIKWADISLDSFTVTLENVKSLVTDKTRAIVVVHLYGMMCPDLKGICKFAKERDIYVIEDCAQSLGSRLDNFGCGSFGDIACFSFHAQKNLTTLGEGGMIAVNSAAFAKKIPGLRLNGHTAFLDKSEYWLPAMTNLDLDIEGVWPIKSSMNEAQGALGCLLLDRLDELTDQRRERGISFRNALAEFSELKFQKIFDRNSHSHHLLPAYFEHKSRNRDDLIRLLSHKYGVKAIVQYHPLHQYDLFIKMGFGEAKVPNTDHFFNRMISFPFSLEILDEDFDYEISAVRDALNEVSK